MRPLALATALVAVAPLLSGCGRSDLESWIIFPSDASVVHPHDAERDSGHDAGHEADAPQAVCVPGEQIACSCTGGDAGAKGITTCVADGGGYGACRGCPDVTVPPPHDSGADTGVEAGCSPGTHDCAGVTPEVCTELGAWRLLPACAGDTPLCIDGACVACSPGTIECLRNVPQVCGMSGAWQPEPLCAQPTPDCSLGLCVCNQTMCVGGCIDVMTDPNNCGACAHSCLGAGCVEGMCQPIVVTTMASTDPLYVGSDGTSVYWNVLGGAVYKAPISAPGPVTATMLANPGGQPTALVVDSSSVFWSTSSGDVWTIPSAGGTAKTIVTVSEGGLAIDGTNLYWGGIVPSMGAGARGSILAMALAGGAITTVATLGISQEPTALAADGTNVYCETSAAGGPVIQSVPRAGGTAVTLTQIAVAAQSLAAGGGEVYWAEQDTNGIPPLDSTIMEVPSSPPGGTRVTLATGQSTVGPIVTDGVNVFWANSCDPPTKPCSAVLELTPGATQVRVVASGQTSVNGIAVDGTRVYWTSFDDLNGDGSVLCVAK